MRIPGLSTGLDTDNLIKQLMDLERIPLTKLERKKDQLNWRKDALSEFKTQLNNLQSKALNLTLESSFTLKKSVSTDETIATASASSSAINGTYSLTVTTLASSSKLTTAALGVTDYAGKATTLVSGSELAATGEAQTNVKFSEGTAGTKLSEDIQAGTFYINSVAIAITRDDTINTVINKINASGAGVTATYNPDPLQDKITLTQKTVGKTKEITVSDNGTKFITAMKLDTGVKTYGEDPADMRLLKDVWGDITSGYFTINNYTFSVNKDTETINDILSKINDSSAGVTAFYDRTTDKLTLTSKTTGTAYMTLGKSTDTSNFLTKSKISSASQSQGTQAAFNLNGQDLTRDSNSFDINGVTFNLKKAGSTTITVSQDTDKIISNIEEFVNQYNTTVGWINDKLAEKVVLKPLSDFDRKSGLLRTDSSLRQVLSYLKTEVFKDVAGLPGTMNQLAEIGISTGTSSGTANYTGKLQIDKDKLKAALAENPSAVADIFKKGYASSSNELVGNFSSGVYTYTLANHPVATSPVPTITVGGTTYTYISSGTPGLNEFKMNYNTGEVTFSSTNPPANGAEIRATYDYTVTTGSDTGIAVRLKSYLEGFTKSGGIIEGRTGSNGIEAEINSISSSIKNMNYRLELREDALWRQFNAMEKALSMMNNQSAWLSGQIGSLG